MSPFLLRGKITLTTQCEQQTFFFIQRLIRYNINSLHVIIFNIMLFINRCSNKKVYGLHKTFKKYYIRKALKSVPNGVKSARLTECSCAVCAEFAANKFAALHVG